MAEVGHIKVGKTIIIIVADRNAHTISYVSYAGFFGDVDEAQFTGFR